MEAKLISEGNELLREYLKSDRSIEFFHSIIPKWDFLMDVYSKVQREQLYETNDEDLDILMIIVGDNLLDSDREGFFLSLVEVVKYLNMKSK